MRLLLSILLSFLLLTSPLFSQSERPESIVVPISSLGDVSETRRQILQNTLTQELSKHFQILPQDRFEQVQEQVFEELDYEECTEDQCIVRIQEILQIENLFHLQVIEEDGDTQLNLKWVNLDEKRNREDYCEGCKTRELRKRIVGLVEKLVGVKEEVVVDTPKVFPTVVQEQVVVEKPQKGVLFLKYENGEEVWFKDGNEKNNPKYVGEISNGVPDGHGTLTWSDGRKYVGEFKDGKRNGQGTFITPDGKKHVGEFKDGYFHGQGTFTTPDGLKIVGEYKDNQPWNTIGYNRNGNIIGRYLNGKFESN